MPPSDTSLETRVVVLETEREYVHGELEENRKEHKEITKVLGSVKEHLAQQNGILPDLKRTLASVQVDVVGVKEKMVRVDLKSRITWALISALTTGLVFALIQIFK